MNKEREAKSGCGIVIALFLFLMFIFWLLGDDDTPIEIKEASNTLNIALIEKSDKDFLCEYPKKIRESWVTICKKVNSPVLFRGVWEISADGSKVFAYNGKALQGLDDVGEYVPAVGSQKPLYLSRGQIPSPFEIDEVFEAFK